MYKWTFNITYHTLYASLLLEFVEPASAGLRLINSSTPGNFFGRSACNSLAFSQIIASETLSPVNCCLLIHTNNNFSTSLIVCNLCFVGSFILFTTSAFLISFFIRQDGTDCWCGLPVHLARLATCTPLSYFLEFYCVSCLLYERNFLWYHGAYLAVVLNKQAQKKMDYYKMFRINVPGDAHSRRNKGRLSPEHMGCWAGCSTLRNEWLSHAGRRMSLVRTIFNCTEIEQMYENWDKIQRKKLLYEN